MRKKNGIKWKIIILLVLVCAGLFLKDHAIGRIIIAVLLVSVLASILLGRFFVKGNNLPGNKPVSLGKKENKRNKITGDKLSSSYTAPEGKPSILDPTVPVWEVVSPAGSASSAGAVDTLTPEKIIPAKRVLMELSCLKCGGTGLKYEKGNYFCSYCGAMYKLQDLSEGE